MDKLDEIRGVLPGSRSGSQGQAVLQNAGAPLDAQWLGFQIALDLPKGLLMKQLIAALLILSAATIAAADEVTFALEGYAHGYDSDSPPVLMNAPVYGHVTYDSATLSSPDDAGYYPGGLLDVNLRIALPNRPDLLLSLGPGDLIAASNESQFALEGWAPENLGGSPASYPAITFQLVWDVMGIGDSLPARLPPGPLDNSSFLVTISPDGDDYWGQFTRVYLVPEPSSAFIAGIAVIALFIVSLRRRTARSS